MKDLVRRKSHQAPTCSVRCHRVIGKHNLSHSARRAVERPVSFHGDNSVCNHQMNWNSGAHVKDALLDALPMENVLRPSVPRTRHDAKHVLHAQCAAGPGGRFDLWLGDQEVGFQHSAGEPQVPHSCIACPQRCVNQFVAIEVNKADLLVSEAALVSTLRKYKFRVALMPWPLSYDDRLSAHTPKGLCCS